MFSRLRAYCILVVATLAVASCAKAPLSEQSPVSVELSLRLGATKSGASDGTQCAATRIVAEAYVAGKGILAGHFEKSIQAGTLHTSITMDLVPSQEFDLVFWADCGEEYYDASSLRKVTQAGGSHRGNDYALDAFCACLKGVLPEDLVEEVVVLRRPLAQINFVATDVLDQKLYNVPLDGYAPKEIEVKYSTPVPVAYDVLESKGVDMQTVSWSAPVLEYDPAGSEALLAVDYLFVETAEKTLVDIGSFTATLVEGDKVASSDITNVPYQRNYRTFIRGEFLSNSDRSRWNVSIEPGWTGETEKL